MKNIFTLLLLLIGFISYSQTYNMSDGSDQTTCSGTFYDPEGTSAYSDFNGTITQTFCSDDGNPITFDFTAFETAENKDFLEIFDGPDNTYTSLGVYDRTDIPGSFTSSDVSNCLTFEWTTDNGGDGTVGWEATISCGVAETCSDGIQNQDETGIDCGGVCPACPAETGDDCSEAILLPCPTADLAGTTLNSTNSEGVNCGSDYGQWYKFTGHGGETTISCTATSGWDHEMETYSGACGSLTSIDCSDSGLSDGTETYTFMTTLNQTYYVYISHWSTSDVTTGNDFTISRTCVVAPCEPVFTLSDGANNCPLDEFYIDVTISSLGTAASVEITNDGGASSITGISATGIQSIGPFASNTTVAVTVENEADAACTDVLSFTTPIACFSILISDADQSICGGAISDTGGDSGDYSNGEDEEIILSPASAGDMIRLVFSVFETESITYDWLEIYDGPSTGAPLIGKWGGTTGPGTITSTAAGGELTLLWHSDASTVDPGFLAVTSCYTPSVMTYVSSTATQTNTADVSPGAPSNEVIGIEIVTTGTMSSIDATSFTFNTTGTDNPATDISNATLWSTGTSGTFATTTQVGAVVASPNGSFTINGTVTLSEGANYFWLTYDVPSGATIGNIIDAQCTSVTVDGSGYVPTTTAPAGSRPIALACGTDQVIASIPYTQTGMTTDGFGDDFSSGDGCATSYLNGDDFVFTYTPAADECISIDLTNTDTYPGIIVTDMCPNAIGANCVDMATSSSANVSLLGLQLTAGTTYYITISTYPSPQFTPFDIDIQYCPPAPPNDEPCNATVLAVNLGSCSYTAGYNNYSANDSEVGQPGITAPGCGTYSGGDIWYKLTVPASGVIIVDMDDNGGVSDMSMAWYTSSTNNCNNLDNLVECDDFQSQNGSMAMICRTDVLCSVPGDCDQNAILTPGETVWVRLWEDGNDVFGAFDICAYEPTPAGPPSDCASATVIGALPYDATNQSTCCKSNNYDASDACASAYMDGEDYVYEFTPATDMAIDITLSGTSSYTGVFVTDKCPDAGGAACVGSQTETGGDPMLCGVALTAGDTYYIIIDTDPSTSTCTDFDINIREAVLHSCGLNYSVSAATFNFESFFGTDISLPIDDRFSSEYISIGFPFCFDGIQYSKLLVSSNGYVIFDPTGCVTNLPTSNATPDGSSAYSIDEAIPNTGDAPRNAILAPWFDINPALSGSISYATLGTTPNRRFIVSYIDVPSFSCTGDINSFQVKLYETSYDIEVHLKEKNRCDTWNDGAGIIGLHNYDGTIAVVAGGTNWPAQWSATNDAYAFTCGCATCVVLLPVELVDFKYECNNTSVILNWSTASETNNDYFTIEKSSDGFEFRTVGTIEGNGNTSVQKNYEFTDTQDGNSYYRLKQTDFDGTEKYYGMINVNCANIKEISISPNPAVVGEEVNVLGEYKHIEVRDMLGKQVKALIINNKITGLQTGVYIVIIDGTKRIKLLIK